MTDPALHDAWIDLLRILTARSNIDGCAGLRRAVEGQSRLIESARAATTGAQHLRLTAAASHWVEFRSRIEARCRQLLGESAAAMRAYEDVLAGCPQDGRLDEGMWRADLALAYLDENEPQRAAEVGLSAVRVATSTSSARVLRAVGRLLPRLRRDRELAAVLVFADAYRAALGAVTMSP